MERRELTRQEALEEALFTGLRLVAGIDLNAMKVRYGADVWALYGSELER